MIDSKREDELRRDVEMLYFGYRAFTSLPDRILADRGLAFERRRAQTFEGAGQVARQRVEQFPKKFFKSVVARSCALLLYWFP